MFDTVFDVDAREIEELTDLWLEWLPEWEIPITDQDLSSW